MEIGHNADAYRLSAKFYKRRDSVDPRFKMAIWDMNFAYGNADYMEGYRTDTWVYEINDLLPPRPSTNMVPVWWYKLNQDIYYRWHLKQRWAQYRQANLRIDRLMATVDSLATVLTVGGAEYRNSRAYPTWGIYVWPNYYISTSFADEIAYLKQWLVRRIMWMDRQLDYVPEAGPGDLNGDGEVNIADVNALIEYVLAGSADRVADINGDGEVTVADINALIGMILARE